MNDEHNKHTGPEKRPSGEQIITIPNVITLIRLLLVPLAFSVLVNRGHDLLAFALFSIAGFSDFIDGQIARRTNTVTELGKAIDPLVDRFLIAAGVIGLYVVGRLPLWMLVFFVGRDLALLSGLALIRRLRDAQFSVLFLGKLTTVFVLAGFSGLIANLPRTSTGLGWTHSPLLPGFNAEPYCVWVWFVYVGLLLSLATMCGYGIVGIRALVSGSAQAKPPEGRGGSTSR